MVILVFAIELNLLKKTFLQLILIDPEIFFVTSSLMQSASY